MEEVCSSNLIVGTAMAYEIEKIGDGFTFTMYMLGSLCRFKTAAYP